MKDPYKILGVGRGTSAAEIKRAYRQLAKKLHPDLNPGNKAIEHKFKEVSQAHGILGDKAKRKRFDNGEIDASGQNTARQGGFYRDFAERSGGGKYRNFEFGQDLNIDDIISDFFGSRGRGRKTRQRGAEDRKSVV